MESVHDGLRGIIVMACDLAGDGSQLGPETVRRCREGLRIYTETPRSEIILTAGMADTKKWPGHKKPMAIMMSDYFRGWHVPEEDIRVSAWPNNWGSMAEIKVALTLMFFRDNFHRRQPFSSITIVSSNYHIPRLKFIYWKLKRKSEILNEIREISFTGIAGKWNYAAIEIFKFPIFVLRELVHW